MPIPCEQKDTILEINRDIKDLNKRVSEQGAISSLSHEQIDTLFSDLKGIKSSVDQNIGMARARDQKLDSIILKMEETKDGLDLVTRESDEYRTRMEKKVEKIQSTVENGLNKRVTEVTLATEANTKALQQIQLCLEERKRRGLDKQAQLEGKTGWSKFWTLVSFSFDDFVRKYSAMMFGLFILFMAFFIMWFVTKANVFGEKPIIGLLKLLFG